MQAKALEVRDEATFIAILAVNMNPARPSGTLLSDGHVAEVSQRYLLSREGYPCDGEPNILITKLSADGSRASNDPFYWGDRTFATAHAYIIDRWSYLKDGDVIDVQFILGETAERKVSERIAKR